MIVIPSLCASCLLRTGTGTCHAFPGGIPTPVLQDGADHRYPIDGDDSLVWRFDPSKPEQYADWVRYNGGTNRREEED